MIGAGGIRLTGSTATTLTLDHASLSSTRSASITIDANQLDASLDLSVTDSRLSSSGAVMSLRCRGRLNIRVVNSTIKSTSGGEAVNVGGPATQATIAAESSTFTGTFLADYFTSDLQQLVCFFNYFLLPRILKLYQKEFSDFSVSSERVLPVSKYIVTHHIQIVM